MKRSFSVSFDLRSPDPNLAGRLVHEAALATSEQHLTVWSFE